MLLSLYILSWQQQSGLFASDIWIYYNFIVFFSLKIQEIDICDDMLFQQALFSDQD